MKYTLSEQTIMYTRLSDGAVRAEAVPAGTPVNVLLTTNAPEGDIVLIETLDQKYRANRVIELNEDAS